MDDAIRVLAGWPVFVCASDGPRLEGEADALDLMGRLWGLEADWVAVPTSLLAEDFLRLRTGVLGAVVQKFVNYRLKLAVVGDIAAPAAASEALRDFVREANAGDHVWFVADLAELEQRLAARSVG
ncbi:MULTISPECIES: DUF4180 domain-containing protein [unclassified Brevundimonas]|uniref:DUF4180 domain-containing protein n=1 Tax=unclassified Brevundimonas TaxID=2622653 RepID=UPI003F8FB918